MKIIKSMKKLKFWSRKKRKKKPNFDPYTTYPHHPPPPLPPTYHYHHCYSCSSSSTQPSAPPLPPWLEYQQTLDAVFAAESVHPGPDLVHPAEPQFSFPEIVVETASVNPTMLPVSDNSSISYQQYMVPNPVYGLPVVQTTRRERLSGFFGIVFKFGSSLFRCFCPCFHIREAYEKMQ
ncbi:Homeobox protein [Melia azedarach]|uniref:Homeobox protein n=1 Tax=Melia azedarach TaxID=155640 RepID=A0ACC1Y2A9_MELAZ|nr:Homeobox protein [Melia azedarach]